MISDEFTLQITTAEGKNVPDIQCSLAPGQGSSLETVTMNPARAVTSVRTYERFHAASSHNMPGHIGQVTSLRSKCPRRPLGRGTPSGPDSGSPTSSG